VPAWLVGLAAAMIVGLVGSTLRRLRAPRSAQPSRSAPLPGPRVRVTAVPEPVESGQLHVDQPHHTVLVAARPDRGHQFMTEEDGL
jgi:hypothetical protein